MHEDVPARGPEQARPVVVLAGGGTGGHLYPALGLGHALHALDPSVRCVYFGAVGGVEARILPQRGVEHVLLPVRGLRRDKLVANVGVVVDLAQSIGATWRRFRALRPGVVVVTGGYAGAPAGLVAGWQGIPLVLQEQNAVPGVTTRMLAKRAAAIHVAFPEAADQLPERARSAVLNSGNPIVAPDVANRAGARASFRLPESGPVLLVVGGSQGSEALNARMKEVVAGLATGALPRPDGLSVLWATGPTHFDQINEGFGTVPAYVRIVPYIDQMARAMSVATLAISRAGAMTTSEMLAWGLPMVLVPLPTAAADHQTANARTLEAAGVATCLPQEGLTGVELWGAVLAILANPEEAARRREAALIRARPHAATDIAKSLLGFLRQGVAA